MLKLSLTVSKVKKAGIEMGQTKVTQYLTLASRLHKTKMVLKEKRAFSTMRMAAEIEKSRKKKMQGIGVD